jgi:hypothetical protein
VLVVALIPILVLGAFGGTTFLAHAHDGHGSHLHAAPSIADARQFADLHRLTHALGVSTCDDGQAGHNGVFRSGNVLAEPIDDHDFPSPGKEPSELVITIPDHDQLVSRGIDLSPTLQAAQVLQSALAWFWAQPHVEQDRGSPGGSIASNPLQLTSRTVRERLVRTSNALLI